MINDSKNITLIMVAILGAGFSILMGLAAYQYEINALNLQFKNEMNEKAASIEREISVKLEVLYAIKGFFNNSEFVSEVEFNHFTQAILARHPDILALEWAPKILQDDRSAFTAEKRKLYPHFEITQQHSQGLMLPAKRRPVHFPVVYYQPQSQNELMFGFDMLSEPKRAKAIHSAIDTNQAKATELVNLIQFSAEKAGFLVFLPVYQSKPITTEQRRKFTKGLIIGAYLFEDVLTEVFDHSDAIYYDIQIFDSTESQDTLLFVHTTSSTIQAETDSYFSKALKPIHGRQWTLIATPSEAYFEQTMSSMPYIACVVSLLFVVLIMTFSYVLVIKNKLLEQSKLHLEAISRTDSLTNIANRRHFDEVILNEWSRARREKTPLTLLMIDIDHFKVFNDTYGHVRGDACLKEVAQALNQSVTREYDFVARYGGEEFAIILPLSNHVSLIAERCRHNVEALQIPHRNSPSGSVVTITVGVATLTPDADKDLNQLIVQADTALYQAKEQGRNCVVFA